jgi:hypothetical protein
MTQEQREEIEELIGMIVAGQGTSQALYAEDLLSLASFARQQLNLRVDGEKLRQEIWKRFTANIKPKHNAELEALVMECLTTEEKF